MPFLFEFPESSPVANIHRCISRQPSQELGGTLSSLVKSIFVVVPRKLIS